MKKKIISSLVCCSMLMSALPSMLNVTANAYGIEIMNFDYDDNIGFTALGAAKTELASNEGHSGKRSVLVSGRASEADGAKISVETTGAAAAYNITLWVKSKSTCKLTAAFGGKKVNSANLIADEWTKLSGKVNIDVTDDKLDLEIYGLSGTDDFYIDDVSVLADG